MLDKTQDVIDKAIRREFVRTFGKLLLIFFITMMVMWYIPHWYRIGKFSTEIGIKVEQQHDGDIWVYTSEPGNMFWRFYSPTDITWYFHTFSKDPKKHFPELVKRIKKVWPPVPEPVVILRHP